MGELVHGEFGEKNERGGSRDFDKKLKLFQVEPVYQALFGKAQLRVEPEIPDLTDLTEDEVLAAAADLAIDDLEYEERINRDKPDWLEQLRRVANLSLEEQERALKIMETLEPPERPDQPA